MVSTRFLRRALVLAAIAAAGPLASASGQVPAKELLQPTTADFAKLHQLIKRQPGESRWMEIEWYPSIWEARQKAAALGKPLFIWAGSGGAPAAGC